MLRHPENTNLKLFYGSTYRGFRVQTARGPLIENYLDRLFITLDCALRDHPRTLAFRVDLRIPNGMPVDVVMDNAVVQRFVDSFKAKIAHNRRVCRQTRGRVHDTNVHFAWAREIGRGNKPHFHFVFFLNYDAFCALGQFQSGRDNNFNRLQEAWASALSLYVQFARGLVEIPDNARYVLTRHDREGLDEFIYRASYLCKAATKVYGDGCHSFGTSRIY